MLIDKPQCNFQNCRYCFDGNCRSADKYENCQLTDLHYRIAKLTVDLDNAKTDDVVPRAEVEALQRRYDLAVAERGANAKALIEANIDLDAMRGAANSFKMHYDDVKRETAREIFEEIEKWLPIIDYPIIAELKKKYTEGNDEKR